MAGAHGAKEQEQGRSPDCSPRGSRPWVCNRRAGAGGEGGAGWGGHAREKTPFLSWLRRDAKDPTCGADLEVDLAHPGVALKVEVAGLGAV